MTLFEDMAQRVENRMVGVDYGVDGISSMLGGWKDMGNLLLEKRQSITMEENTEVRLEVKLERSLGWLQMHLPRISREKVMQCLMD